jgi:hypothetical protein
MNNMGREIMAALKRFQVGSDGDGVTVGGSLVVSGSTTANTFSATNVTASGNLTFTGTGNRITGDFSNATVANRVLFQTSTVNGATRVHTIPNGTGVVSAIAALNNSDPNNASFMQVSVNATEAQLVSTLAGTGTYLPMTFYTGGSERMRIDTSGNVGIGTSSPASRLQVVGAAGFGNGAAGSAATISSTTTGNSATTLGFATGSGSTFDIILLAAGASPANGVVLNQRNNAPMAFNTDNAERMRIDSSGNLLVGKTALPSASVFGFAVNNAANNFSYLMNSINTTGSGTHFEFYNPNGKIGSITTNSSATAYNTSSDYRLKNTIAPMTGALAKVAALKPCTYKWNADGSDGEGFIAHELAEVVPGCVTGEKDAVDADGNPQYQGVDTSFLVATLTAAIQELSAKNDALEARIATLEAQA